MFATRKGSPFWSAACSCQKFTDCWSLSCLITSHSSLQTPVTQCPPSLAPFPGKGIIFAQLSFFFFLAFMWQPGVVFPRYLLDWFMRVWVCTCTCKYGCEICTCWHEMPIMLPRPWIWVAWIWRVCGLFVGNETDNKGWEKSVINTEYANCFSFPVGWHWRGMWDLGICLKWAFFSLRLPIGVANVTLAFPHLKPGNVACWVRLFFGFPNHLSMWPKELTVWTGGRVWANRRHGCRVEALGSHLSWSLPGKVKIKWKGMDVIYSRSVIAEICVWVYLNMHLEFFCPVGGPSFSKAWS